MPLLKNLVQELVSKSNDISEEESVVGGSGLMDTNNCIQYRVTGGGEAGAGAMSTGGYRPVVVSSNGDNSDTNHGGTNTTALSNVQVGSGK